MFSSRTEAVEVLSKTALLLVPMISVGMRTTSISIQSMQGNSSPADLQYAKDFALPARTDETVGLIANETGDVGFYAESGSGEGIIVALDPTWTEDGRIIFTKYFTYFGTIEGEAVWAGEVQSRLVGTFLGTDAQCLQPQTKPQCIQIAPIEQGRDCSIYNSLGSPLTQCDQSLSNIAAQNDANGLALLYTDNTQSRCAACARPQCDAEYEDTTPNYVGMRPWLNDIPAPEGLHPNYVKNSGPPLDLGITATVIPWSAFENAIINLDTNNTPGPEELSQTAAIVAAIDGDEVAGAIAVRNKETLFKGAAIYIVALDPRYVDGNQAISFTKSIIYTGYLEGTAPFIADLQDFYSENPADFNPCVFCLDPDKRAECAKPPVVGGGCPACFQSGGGWTNDCNGPTGPSGPTFDTAKLAYEKGVGFAFVDNDKEKCDLCNTILCNDMLQDPDESEGQCLPTVSEFCQHVAWDDPSCLGTDPRIPRSDFAATPVCTATGLPGGGTPGVMRSNFGGDEETCKPPEICKYFKGALPNYCDPTGTQFQNETWWNAMGCQAAGGPSVPGSDVTCCGPSCACVHRNNSTKTCYQCDTLGNCEITQVPAGVDPRLIEEDCAEGVTCMEDRHFSSCPTGQHFDGDNCVLTDQGPCPEGTEPVGGTCKKKKVENGVDPNDYITVEEESPEKKKPLTEKKKKKKGATDGDPVLLSSGALLLDTTDIARDQLTFSRTYISNTGFRGALGSNWQHNFEKGSSNLTVGLVITSKHRVFPNIRLFG